MAGNVTPIRGAGQVAYRLGGAHDLDNEQIAYRLGEQTDARHVLWVGDGGTARALGVRSGQVVSGEDAVRVRALMNGLNPETGEVLVAPKLAVAEAAKVAAVPGYDAIVVAASERGMEPGELFASGRDRSDWDRLARTVVSKGDSYRTPAERIAKLGRAAGVDVGAVYEPGEWDAAIAAKDDRDRIGVMGYDVGLTLPKGASLALVMDTDTQRRDRKMALWQVAVVETYEELGERVAYGSVGHHGDGQMSARIDGSGIVGTATVEVTSRAGDPHVHAHAMLANLTICEDGKARTIGAGGYDVVVHGAWAAERARLKYRTETTREGLAAWAWNVNTGEYDDATISADAKALGSKRHNAIAADKDTRQGESAAAVKAIDAMAERVTRDAKGETVETLDEVAERFAAETAEAGILLRGDNGLKQINVGEWRRQDWTQYLDQILTEHKAVFTATQVQTAVQRVLPVAETDTVTAVANAYLADKGVLRAVDTALSTRLAGGSRYTTQGMLDAEQLVYATTAEGIGRANHTIDARDALSAIDVYQAAEGFQFNSDQHEMVLSWLSGGNQVQLIVGAAGTGKTAAADAARFAWEREGLRVMGISTAGLAAQNLGDAASIEVSTAAGLVNAIEQGRGPSIDVLVWDEMGMAATREQAVILPWAAANGVDVRGMGDAKQLDSVGAGSTYAKQCEIVGAIELTEIMRQQNPHERAAVAAFRAGDTGTAMAVYADTGQIVVASTPEHRITLMAQGWANDVAGVADRHERLSASVMLSQTRASVEALQTAARDQARARGWITGDDVVYRGPWGQRSYALGEAVLVKKTMYRTGEDQQPTVYNGQRAIVTAIDPKTRAVTIEWKRGDSYAARTLSADYVAANIAPGYALTVHGAQGQSIGKVHSDPTDVSRNAAYVQLTRDKERVTVYTDLNTLGVFGQERQEIMALSGQQRAAWAARELAARIDQWGWGQTETAHEATATPVAGADEQLQQQLSDAPLLADWDRRDHRLLSGKQLDSQLRETSAELAKLQEPITDDDVGAAAAAATAAVDTATQAREEYEAAKAAVDARTRTITNQANQAMAKAAELNRTLRNTKGVAPAKRRASNEAAQQLEQLNRQWGVNEIPDPMDHAGAKQFRQQSINAVLRRERGQEPDQELAAKHSVAVVAEQAANAADAASRRIQSVANNQPDAGRRIAELQRKQAALQTETRVRSQLTPAQKNAEMHVRRAVRQQPPTASREGRTKSASQQIEL